jgi:ABC-type branched-subunit amino acid transport system substrate-binding protein
MLQQDGLIGAVGPACSHAAMAAARIFDEDGPAALVSFAATAEPLSNRDYFATLFRTV